MRSSVGAAGGVGAWPRLPTEPSPNKSADTVILPRLIDYLSVDVSAGKCRFPPTYTLALKGNQWPEAKLELTR